VTERPAVGDPAFAARLARAKIAYVETATQTLHRLTSFGADVYDHWESFAPPVDDPRVVREFEPNDPARRTWRFKRYKQPLPRVALPRDLPHTAASALAVLSGTAEVSRHELDLSHLSRLLHLCAGVVRTTEAPFGTFPFRAAGSAGGRFPLEVYVAVPEGFGVLAGVHWYDPPEHMLVQIASPPQGGVPTVVVTGVPWRTGWRYRERGYRHIYWDAGTMLSQLLAAADSAGLEPSLYTRFPDAVVSELVGAEGVHEWPVAVVALGEGPPTLERGGVAAAGDVDAAPLEFPLVTAAQRAGDRDELGPRWDRGAPVEVADEGKPIEDVVLARSSQRRMDRTRAVQEGVFRTCMSVALRGIDVPHRVVVHNVTGVASGLYRWPDVSTPVRGGNLRREVSHACGDPGLPRDAAFVVIAATDVGALGDRDYREAQLAAGVVEGRLHLLGYALGASASGMTFVDSEMRVLLAEGLDGLLVTCVGVPEYIPKPGGPPGKPTPIRLVQPRVDDETD
jgi:hypothetical protein